MVSLKEKMMTSEVKSAMHIAASGPLALNTDDIDKNIVDKELEIISEEPKILGNI